MENYYLVRIKECEMQIEIYDKMFHFACEKHEDDLAQEYSEEITYAIKRKLEYIERLEDIENGF